MTVSISYEGAAEGAGAVLGKRLLKEARALLKEVGLVRREVSLVLTDDVHIRELNRTWRGEDKATDVLSFPMDEPAVSSSAAVATRPKSGPLGDIVLSLETTAKEAVAIGWQRDDFASFLLVHGFCHLLGHDHGEPDEAAAMKADEDRFFAVVAPGVARPPTPY